MLFDIFRALSGLLVSYFGFVNIFWGNDPYYRLIVFSLSFFPSTRCLCYLISLRQRERGQFFCSGSPC